MARSEKLVAEVRRIAGIIGKHPVLGHWPHMEAGKDVQILLLAANFMESLDREVTAVAKIGHDLMASQSNTGGVE
jgi:hypothetical protein